MDKELWMRYLCMYGLSNVKQTDDILVAFRLHGSSKTTNQQILFEKETNSLFHKLAQEYGLNDVVKEIDKLGISFYITEKRVFSGLKQDKAMQVLQYFYLQKAFRLYALNDFEECRYFLNHIDGSFISDSDQFEIQKINDRMKYPVAIKKLINWYHKIRR